MFKNLFSKKNDGFYLQVEESPVTNAPPAEQTAPAPVEAAVEPTPTPKATKTSVKDKKKEQKIEPVPASVAVAVETTVTTSATTFANFAPDYLIKPSSNSSRRRPGANMQQFVDMARQVQFSSRSKGNERRQG